MNNTCADCEFKWVCKAWMLIAKERGEQDVKWDEQNHSDEWWLTILMEEVGELSKEILEVKFDKKRSVNLINELIQVNAVALAWLECKIRNDIYLCKFFKGGDQGEFNRTSDKVPEK